MNKKTHFWTPGELMQVKEAISKFKNGRKAAEFLHKVFQHRSYAAIYQKVLSLKARTVKQTKTTTVTTPAAAIPTEPKGITVPKGFTFDINPSRAVLFEDHVRLYF
jgi:hypothetical protein